MGEAETPASSPLTREEVFLDCEPYYLAIGMTHDQYWYDDPWLVVTYKQAHTMKIEMRNQELWLQGAYFFNALSVAFSNFGQSLSKKNRKPQQKYLEKPIRITPLTESEQAIKVREERQKTIDFFTNLQRKWEKNNQKGGDDVSQQQQSTP